MSIPSVHQTTNLGPCDHNDDDDVDVDDVDVDDDGVDHCDNGHHHEHSIKWCQ